MYPTTEFELVAIRSSRKLVCLHAELRQLLTKIPLANTLDFLLIVTSNE